MARPKKQNTEKLNCYLRSRCTSEELDTIQLRANELSISVSEYIRSMALNGRIVVKQSKYDSELVYQLRKIGVNINQQTQRLNPHARLPAALPPLWDKLSRILDDVINTV